MSLEQLNIGICRTSPIGILPEIYEDNDYTSEFIKGFIEMFVNEHDIKICSPIKTNEEKIFNNQKIHTKYPFVKKIKYTPYEKKQKLDLLMIFPKSKNEEKHFIDELTYEEYISDLIKENQEVKVFYFQYNEVVLDTTTIDTKNLHIIYNSSLNNEVLNNKYYPNQKIKSFSLDFMEFIFQQRIPTKDNFYNRVGLFNKLDRNDYSIIKTPNSMLEYIYSLNPFNNEEDNEYIKNDFTFKYNILIDKMQSCNFIFVDKNDNSDFYNSNFIIISNNSYPVLFEDNDIHIPIEDFNIFNEEDINSYYSQKYLKQLRIDIKKYFTNYNVKNRLEKIFKEL